MDREWATVGSSNLDPLSLALNLEANVVIRDEDFNSQLAQRLEHIMEHSCKIVTSQDVGPLRGWPLVRSFVVYHVTRLYPDWASWLPKHAPRLRPAWRRLHHAWGKD